MEIKFFANGLTGSFLRNVLPQGDTEVEWVKAAIAYGDDDQTLLDNCLNYRRRLDIWMRYDHRVPVAPALLRRMLQCAPMNVFCRLVPDVLHAKVIWWRGYGVYIGSANLTERAWVSNIEFGVFLPEAELESSGDLGEIEMFFDALDAFDEVFDLSEEVILEQEAILKARSAMEGGADARARSMRSIAHWKGPAFIGDKRAVIDRQEDAFIKEWRNGVTILHAIAELAPRYRPSWLNDDVPASWQADQFLHAYYYNQVIDGPAHPYEDFFRRNFRDPVAATEAALVWWSQLRSPPSEEDINCHERAPLIKKILAADRIKSITLEDLVALFEANHSSRDHIRRMTFDQLHVTSPEDAPVDRNDAFARLMWNQRNRIGQTVGELIAFVLDGGRSAEMPSRLFAASRSGELKFPHLGRNQLAELAGWARPDKFAPRNGRTSKALRALGYKVRIY